MVFSWSSYWDFSSMDCFTNRLDGYIMTLKDRLKMIRKAVMDSLKVHTHTRENARRVRQRERREQRN